MGAPASSPPPRRPVSLRLRLLLLAAIAMSLVFASSALFDIASFAPSLAVMIALGVGIVLFARDKNEGAGDNKGGDGPRSTPAFDGGKVYVYGSFLDLHCFDAKTGAVLWEFPTSSGVIGQPSTFTVDGVQYVAVQSGWGVDAQRKQEQKAAEAKQQEPTGRPFA